MITHKFSRVLPVLLFEFSGVEFPGAKLTNNLKLSNIICRYCDYN